MPSEIVYADVVCLDEHDPELRRAWATFADPVVEHRGEVWHYMGTSHRDDAWQHHFRHRCHPQTNNRMIVKVTATDDWEPTAR